MRAMVLDVTPQEESPSEALAETTQVLATDEAPQQEIPVVAAVGFDADLAEAGAKVFRKCKSCHQIGEGAKNKVGPILTGIVGSAAGAVDGFKYSTALKAVAEGGLVWSPEELAAFLTKPKAYMKGTKMSFVGLKKEDDQAAIVEYLKSFAE
jgi:cytochrome c2